MRPDLNAVFTNFDRSVEQIIDGLLYSRTPEPFVDYDDTGAAYELRMDMPGVKKEDLKLELKDSFLTVSGLRKSSLEKRPERKFQKVLELPPTIDTERVEADLTDGVLSLRLPKTKAAQPRMIPLKSS